ncbi:replication-relaxation family protein [bacterium]|nr:MAG: replication-relaxation family protein [bacterium]
MIAQLFGKSSGVFVFKRLKILRERGLIGQRFDSSYRIKGKPAAYYLLPAGARALQDHYDATGLDVKVNVKSIYKDGSVSETFIEHCLDIFAVFNLLKSRHGKRVKFFQKRNSRTMTISPTRYPTRI